MLLEYLSQPQRQAKIQVPPCEMGGSWDCKEKKIIDGKRDGHYAGLSHGNHAKYLY